MIRKIYINNVPYSLREGSLQINEQVNERSTCSFIVVTDYKDIIKKGMHVEIWDEFSTLLFRGHVDTPKYKDYGNGTRHYSVSAIDYHYLIDKRIWTRGFTEKFSGDIVAQLVDEVLSGEGITITQESVQLGVTIPLITFNYEYADKILDQLCEFNSFIWYVDYDKILWFIDPKTHDNGQIVTDSIVKFDSLTVEDKNPKYRNKQYIKGAMGTTDVLTQEFKGDGKTLSFALGYQLHQKPEIYVNNVKVAYDDIVQKGYNDTAKWYYEKGDNIIVKNELHAPLSGTDILKIIYVGSYPIVATTLNAFEIINQQNISGGTGLVEIVDKVENVDNMQQAIQLAVSKLKLYSQENNKVVFTTSESYFKVGELISFNLPELQDNGYVIEKIDISDERNFMWHKITAVKGPLHDSWAKVFAKGFDSSKPVITETISKETAVLTQFYEKTWVFSDHPNIMKLLFPGNDVKPNNTLYPMFKYEERLTHLEIINDKNEVLYTCPRMIQNGNNTNTIETLFYVNPFDAVGVWNKIKFYGGKNILIDEVYVSLDKSSVEGVQIQRVDRKGW